MGRQGCHDPLEAFPAVLLVASRACLGPSPAAGTWLIHRAEGWRNGATGFQSVRRTARSEGGVIGTARSCVGRGMRSAYPPGVQRSSSTPSTNQGAPS